MRETETGLLAKNGSSWKKSGVPGEEGSQTSAREAPVADYAVLDFDTSDPSYMEAREAAKTLGVNQRAVRNLIGRKTLEGKTKGEGAAARLMVSVASVERLRSERKREHRTLETSRGERRVARGE